MIDIHCHILPAIDDGPSDTEESIEMARIAAEDGITHLVATPHFRYSEKPTVHDIRRGLEELRKKVSGKGIPVTLLSGADIKLTYELIGGIETNGVPTINASRYFLLELPDLIPPNLANFLFTAGLKGLVPIITHPERNYSIFNSPQKMEVLRDSGVLFQVTAMSITGGFGGHIKSLSRMFLKKGFVDFVASDAHDRNLRTPVLSEAYREVSGISDEKLAKRIFFENPRAVLENREIMR